MNILVINGSPKGKNSVTLQTCNYLQILHPEHNFRILHAGQTIKALEKDINPLTKSVSAQRIAENADIFDFEITREDISILECIYGHQECFHPY